jgi:hypothetical protein
MRRPTGNAVAGIDRASTEWGNQREKRLHSNSPWVGDSGFMSGDVVVLVTAIGVLLIALIGAALVSWWVWIRGGTDI